LTNHWYHLPVKKTAVIRSKRADVPISRYRVQVLDRTIAVLQAVAESDTDLAAAEIARQLRLHKSTVHRLLVVLEHYRLIKRGPEGTYRVGHRPFAAQRSRAGISAGACEPDR
jgi:predicted ArsR family transcriptional regulator